MTDRTRRAQVLHAEKRRRLFELLGAREELVSRSGELTARLREVEAKAAALGLPRRIEAGTVLTAGALEAHHLETARREEGLRTARRRADALAVELAAVEAASTKLAAEIADTRRAIELLEAARESNSNP